MRTETEWLSRKAFAKANIFSFFFPSFTFVSFYCKGCVIGKYGDVAEARRHLQTFTHTRTQTLTHIRSHTDAFTRPGSPSDWALRHQMGYEDKIGVGGGEDFPSGPFWNVTPRLQWHIPRVNLKKKKLK